MIAIEPKARYCINCDNRHGCKSKTPPCIVEMMSNNVQGIEGKTYLTENNKTILCEDCPFFRTCWRMEEYNRLIK